MIQSWWTDLKQTNIYNACSIHILQMCTVALTLSFKRTVNPWNVATKSVSFVKFPNSRETKRSWFSEKTTCFRRSQQNALPPHRPKTTKHLLLTKCFVQACQGRSEGTPKSSMFIGFSTISHAFCQTDPESIWRSTNIYHTPSNRSAWKAHCELFTTGDKHAMAKTHL